MDGLLPDFTMDADDINREIKRLTSYLERFYSQPLVEIPRQHRRLLLQLCLELEDRKERLESVLACVEGALL